ncbi:MAG: T9SS type A sorting domain-containing protein [Bacteroidota bacterium]
MKQLLPFLFFSLFCFVGQAQIQIWNAGVNATNVNVDGAPVVLSQIDISTDQPGYVLVTFDGDCIASPGDRIILAANKAPDWIPNGGSVAMEAVDYDVNRMPFAHSQVYQVEAGNHSFYAVAENWVEHDGNGLASIYGNLSVRFFPATEEGGAVRFEPVVETNMDLQNGPEVVAEIDFEAPAEGKVILRFDGYFVGDEGDRIIVAASDTPTWGVNDGNVGLEAISSDINRRNFSHTRVYDVSAGLQTFYAVADNYVETEGSGIASIYANLVMEFYPLDGGEVQMEAQTISTSSLNVEGSPTIIAETQIDAPKEGKVLLRFDGLVVPTVGDRIVLAASDHPDWSVNDGNIGAEIPNTDQNKVSFSHSRMYEVTPGVHPFYAVAENYVENDGNGSAYFYGTLTSTFIPNEWDPVNFTEEVDLVVEQFEIYPNPVQSQTVVFFPKPSQQKSQLQLIDAESRILQSWEVVPGEKAHTVELADLPAGVYWMQWIRGDVIQTHTLIKS